MKKIIVDDAIPYIEGRLESDFDVRYMDGTKISKSDLEDASALLVRTRTRCNRDLLEGTKVEFVGTATIGMDHYDMPALNAMDIEAVNAPGCNAPAVAQYVWASLLRLGFLPGKHKLGIVGYGHVGGRVAEWGRLLGVKMLICDPPRKERGLKDVEYTSIEQIAKECDAVTFHTPLTFDGNHPSYHLGDREFFSNIRQGAMIVNAARGGVVDEKALMACLRTKGLRCAIDTWEGEKGTGPDPTLLYDAIIATPHIAGYSRQGKERATRMVLDSLNRHFGTRCNISALEGDYRLPATLTPEDVLKSYDPLADTFLLRNTPGDFEFLRNSYLLREEI